MLGLLPAALAPRLLCAAWPPRRSCGPSLPAVALLRLLPLAWPPAGSGGLWCGCCSPGWLPLLWSPWLSWARFAYISITYLCMHARRFDLGGALLCAARVRGSSPRLDGAALLGGLRSPGLLPMRSDAVALLASPRLVLDGAALRRAARVARCELRGVALVLDCAALLPCSACRSRPCSAAAVGGCCSPGLVAWMRSIMGGAAVGGDCLASTVLPCLLAALLPCLPCRLETG